MEALRIVSDRRRLGKKWAAGISRVLLKFDETRIPPTHSPRSGLTWLRCGVMWYDARILIRFLFAGCQAHHAQTKEILPANNWRAPGVLLLLCHNWKNHPLLHNRPVTSHWHFLSSNYSWPLSLYIYRVYIIHYFVLCIRI